ncbi:MAG: Rhamnulokinase [Actinobacteria bacterium ADurb.Bin346]|nr:MAG: Rhamnulokinase [Actinobacteria bacterium ADurb.Bin346]
MQKTSKYFLIFDFGASNGRASVASYDGNRFDFEVVHRFDNIPVYAGDTLYWDFLKLYSELKSGLTAAVKKYGRIESLGIDTWGVDFGLIDKNGALISNPVHYRDKHRNSMPDEVYKLISAEEIFDLTGAALVSYYGLFNLFSLKVRNASEYICADKLLMMPDLFNYFLTGIAVNEYTEAHTSMMVNPISMQWEKKLLEKLGLKTDIFNEIIQPGTILGDLQKSVCEELGIGPVSVVAPASHDTPSAVAGIPIIDKNRNSLLMSTGTWNITILEMDKPLINNKIFESGYANEAGVEGKTLLFKNFVGMWLIQKSRDKWLKESADNLSWDDIMYLAKDTPSSKSFIDVDANDFIVEVNDMPGAVKRFCKNTGQAVPGSIGEIARVIYESMVCKVRQNLDTLENLTGKKFDCINMVGGGTKDVLLCQWLADATGLTVYAGPTETASVGNLIMQLKAAGEIKNLDEGRQIAHKSAVVKEYVPGDKDYWDEAYNIFRSISGS